MKIVIVVANGLPAATAANTSALLALTIGARHPEIIGADVLDADGASHAGISGVPVPVLTAPAERLRHLAAAADPVDAVGFTTVAARARTYEGYTTEMAETHAADLEYLGVALLGPDKAVRSLTGSLPLLRG